MKNYKVKIIETYAYYLDIEANDEKEALKKVKTYYNNEEDGVTGISNTSSFEKVKYKVLK